MFFGKFGEWNMWARRETRSWGGLGAGGFVFMEIGLVDGDRGGGFGLKEGWACGVDMGGTPRPRDTCTLNFLNALCDGAGGKGHLTHLWAGVGEGQGLMR